ncbi:MAG: glycosyltransferase [Verrucomicrobiota bacterium]
MQLSVIICTHNPRKDYLRRTLDALKVQTLPLEHWELLLIDNASKESLAGQWDLSWHPHARHIREENLGLTPARLAGIRESGANILVFVDDDNVLAANYLQKALDLTVSHPWVGAFGANIIAEFETKPEAGIEPLVPWVGLIEVKDEEWVMGPGASALRCAPIGAGMVIHKRVAVHYAQLVSHDPLRQSLDRKGTSLLCHGDTDMALCSCALGLAVGRFPQLQFTHLIPTRRLNRDYLLRLIESAAFSDTVFHFIWSRQLPSAHPEPAAKCASEKIFQAYKNFRARLRGPIKPSVVEQQQAAWRTGYLKAVKFLHER